MNYDRHMTVPSMGMTPRRVVRTALLTLALSAAVGGGAAVPAIQPDLILRHIEFLASDDLQGRANGSDGLERAANYIAAQFHAVGLRPGGGQDEWLQRFELTAGLDIAPGNELIVGGRGREHSIRLSLGESYLPLAATPREAAPRPADDMRRTALVFAGYGISAPTLKYDDYAGTSVRGKAVLVFSHEPQEDRSDSPLNGSRPLQESSLYGKALAARTRGARALLVVSDPSHRIDPVNYGAFALEPDAEDHGIPVLRVRRDDIAPLLELWGLDRVAADIDRDLKPRSRALPGATIDYTERLSTKRRVVGNVLGVLPGSDSSRANQAIVLGAHYDHIGRGVRFSNSPERTGEIHNGADDNASGVAALIEMARAAAADRPRFPISLIFIAFAGEERGLLGSAHYTASPVVPLADTFAMLNLDMVGRSRGWVEVGGLDESPSLAADVDAAASAAGGVEIRRGGPGAGRSDDSSFVAKRVPALHFFTGFHADYHAPNDDTDRINAAGTAHVATLALELAARISARRARPEFGATR